MCVLLFCGCASKPVAPERATTAIESDGEFFQVVLNEAQQKGHLPALGALVRVNGKTVYQGAQGKRSLQFPNPVTAADVWHLGSDTKAMTAFLIALAVQEGRLKYDSKVVDLLGPLPRHELNRDLTVADLLSHGSGLLDLQEIHGGKLWRKLFESKAELTQQRLEMSVAALAEPPHLDKSTGRPLRTFSYANVNYIILGAILDKAYKSPWEKLIVKKLFNPLAMKSCGFGVAGKADEKEPSQPWPHVKEGGKLVGVQPKHKLDNPPFLGPAGTVHCNLADWQKFVLELIATWKGQGRLLKDAKVTAKYFDNATGSIYTYGGWGRSDEKYKTAVLSHNGSNTFNYAVAVFAPEKDTVILLTANSGQKEAESALEDLRKQIIERFLQ